MDLAKALVTQCVQIMLPTEFGLRELYSRKSRTAVVAACTNDAMSVATRIKREIRALNSSRPISPYRTEL